MEQGSPVETSQAGQASSAQARDNRVPRPLGKRGFHGGEREAEEEKLRLKHGWLTGSK